MPLPDAAAAIGLAPRHGVRACRSRALTCRVVQDAAQAREHARIRTEVFVAEQRLFAGTDADAHDEDPATLHVLGFVGDVAAGTVRLYPLEERGLWQGDRLAVLPEWRHDGLGAPLVRFAVATAGVLGGLRMVAMVQVPNVEFFVRLGWQPVGEPRPYVGVLHQQMAIGLGPGPVSGAGA